MKKEKEKWAVLCGTGMDENYLTDSGIFEATHEEMFHLSPGGIEGGILDEFCGQENSFPIKLTSKTKGILKDLVKELEKIK